MKIMTAYVGLFFWGKVKIPIKSNIFSSQMREGLRCSFLEVVEFNDSSIVIFSKKPEDRNSLFIPYGTFVATLKKNEDSIILDLAYSNFTKWNILMTYLILGFILFLLLYNILKTKNISSDVVETLSLLLFLFLGSLGVNFYNVFNTLKYSLQRLNRDYKIFFKLP